MSKCNVTFNLKSDKSPIVVIPDDLCKPMLITKIDDGERQNVIIRHPDGAIFFEAEGGAITYCDDKHWLKENYTFVRFLSAKEFVTFSGAR